MYGAILGDIIGSPYENGEKMKQKEFPLFIRISQCTDDSIMTIAVAEALMDTMGAPDGERRKALIRSMQKWGRRYPYAGYGGIFRHWIYSENPEPYNSWANGSAMRASPAGWLSENLDGARKTAKLTAEVTHNHPEGIKGAECVAAVVFLARTGKKKEEIREYVDSEFGYDISRTCDEIRPDYEFDVSCRGTVPVAVTAFLEGEGFEDVIRTAVSLGGDCDTVTSIAGAMAEAMYGVPEELKAECRKRMKPDMLEVLARFEKKTEEAPQAGQGGELTLEQMIRDKKPVNDRLEYAISLFFERGSSDEVSASLRSSLYYAYIYNLCCSVPTSMTSGRMRYGIYRMEPPRYAYIACSLSEGPAGYPGESTIFLPWRTFIKYVLSDEDCEGLMINSARTSPQGSVILMSRPVLQMIMECAEKAMSELPDNVRDAVIKGI